MFKKILVDFLWNHLILEKILHSMEDHNKIIIFIPRKIEYWATSNIFSKISSTFPEYEVQYLKLKELSKWESKNSNLILLYRDPVPSIIQPWLFNNENFMIIKIDGNRLLVRRELEQFLNQIFGPLEASTLNNLKWSIINQKFRISDLDLLLDKIIQFFDKIGLELSIYNLNTYTLNILFHFIMEGVLPEMDCNFFRYLEDFLKLNIEIKSISDYKQYLGILVGFNRLIQKCKKADLYIIKNYLEMYKLAEIELLEENLFETEYIFVKIKITFIWIYTSFILDEKQFLWCKEVLWIIKNYNSRKTSSRKFNDLNFPIEFESFFWFKLLISSSFFRRKNDNLEYPLFMKRIFRNVNNRISRIQRKKEKENYKNYETIPIEENAISNIKMYLDENYIREEFVDFYEDIPIDYYKPNLCDELIRYSNKQMDILYKFPELLIFQFVRFKDYNDLEDFFRYIKDNDDIYAQILLFLIFRFYSLLLKEIPTEERDKFSLIDEEESLEIYTLYQNLLLYRSFKQILLKNQKILNKYWNHKYLENNWIFDYHYLRNSFEYLSKLKKMSEIMESSSILEFYKEDFKNFLVPSKFITEYLLYESNFFIHREKLLKSLPDKRILLFVIDGLSYLNSCEIIRSLSKELEDLEYIDGEITINPALISDITKTDIQLSKIWRAIYNSDRNIIVCHDTEIKNNALFKKCEEINVYLKMTEKSEALSYKYQRKVANFYDENNFYFIYISYQESENCRIFDKSTLNDKYKDLLLKIFKDIRKILNNNSNPVAIITSDHGSIFVKPCDFLTKSNLEKMGLSRNGNSRGLFIKNNKLLNQNSEFKDLLIENLSVSKNNPTFSFLPGIALGGKEKYDHSGISVEENIVPWVRIQKKE